MSSGLSLPCTDYRWRLGQYAISNGTNSIPLRDKMTPDPRLGSWVVVSHCDPHYRPAPSPLAAKPATQSVFGKIRHYRAVSLSEYRLIQTFQQQRCSAQPQWARGGGGTGDASKGCRKCGTLERLFRTVSGTQIINSVESVDKTRELLTVEQY